MKTSNIFILILAIFTSPLIGAVKKPQLVQSIDAIIEYEFKRDEKFIGIYHFHQAHYFSHNKKSRLEKTAISKLFFPQIPSFTLSKIRNKKTALMVMEQSKLIESKSLSNTDELNSLVHQSTYQTLDANVIQGKKSIMLKWQQSHHEAWERRFQQFLSHAKNISHKKTLSRSSASLNESEEKKSLLQLQFKMTDTKCLKNKIKKTWRCQFYFAKEKNVIL